MAWPFGKARESAPLPSAVPHSPVSRLGGPGLRPGSSPCARPSTCTFYAHARSCTGSAFTPAGRSSIDEFIFMYFNNNLGDRLDR